MTPEDRQLRQQLLEDHAELLRLAKCAGLLDEFVLSLARDMKEIGIYSPKTYVQDIATSIHRLIGEERTMQPFPKRRWN